jgi:hypothetical protein
MALELLERQRVGSISREGAGAVALETTLAPMLDQRFGEDAPRRITGAEKENVVGAIEGQVRVARVTACGLRP